MRRVISSATSLSRSLFVFSLAVTAAACTAPADPPASPTPVAPAETSAPPQQPAPDPNAEACAAQSAALQNSNDGALGLDDLLSKWIDGVPNGDSITIRELLNHSSGIFNYTEADSFQQLATTKTWTPRELVDVAIANPPYFEPGKGWHHSNTNYVLLGMIAEKAGNAKMGALVRQRVLAKAGLTATFFDGEEPVAGELATGRGVTGADVTHIADPSWAWAAGAIVASPSDVVRWIERVGSGTFYDAATQAKLLTGVKTDDHNVGYGLGIMLFDRAITAGAGPAIGHDGSIAGFHTQAFYFPEKKTTIVSIADSDAENPNDITLVALDVLFGEKTTSP